MAGAAALLFQQAGRLEDLQVLRYRRPAYGELLRQFANGRRPAAQQVDHALARGVREGAQQLQSVSHTLQ